MVKCSIQPDRAVVQVGNQCSSMSKAKLVARADVRTRSSGTRRTRYTFLQVFVKHFEGEDAVVDGAAVMSHARALVIDLGGLDTVDIRGEWPTRVEQEELEE